MLVINRIPSRKSKTPTIISSNFSPALLQTEYTPKARRPASVVPHILFIPLYIVEPAKFYSILHLLFFFKKLEKIK